MNVRHILIAVCAFCALLIESAQAAELSAEQRAAQIAPLVTQHTLVVAHLDLDRVDFAALDKAREAILGPKEQIEQLEKARLAAEALIKVLHQLGAHDVYGVVNINNLPLPSAYLAVAAPNKAEEVRRMLVQTGMDEKGCVVMSGLVVVSEVANIEQLAQLKPVERPELLEAFRAAENSDAQLLLIPSADIRRAIGETVRLPDELGTGANRVIADGIHWAALAVQLKPQPQLMLTVRSKDEAAAQAVQTMIGNTLRLLSQIKSTGVDPAVADRLASKPQVKVDRVIWTLSANNGSGDFVELLREPIRRARTAAARRQNSNNLKQLALSMHNYYDTNNHLPAPAIYDAKGKPLLSWRVSVLPYVEGGELYKEFHLDEPWDSEHNKKLIERMPKVFASLGAHLAAGQTTYLIPTGPNALFGKAEGPLFREILDGTSNTIMIVDVLPDNAVTWTKPDEFEVNVENPTAGLLGPESDGFFTSMADGSVQFWPRDISVEKLLALFGPAEGKPTQ